MKRSTKLVSVILSALTVSAAIASSASAMIISDGAKVVKNVQPKVKAAEILQDEDEFIFYNGAWYRKVTSGRKISWFDAKGMPVEVAPTDNAYGSNPFKTSAEKTEQGMIFGSGQVFKNKTGGSVNPLKDGGKDVTGPAYYWNKGGIIKGGSYYTCDEARWGVQDYFKSNSYSVRMFVGEEQAFSAGANLFSTDPSVVYFNSKTGKLVAKNYGTAEVYVYTTGMIPFFRIVVNVVNPIAAEKKTDSLRVVPDNWELSVGDVTFLSVTSVSGKVYDDIVFDIWQGKGAVGAKNGKFTATDNGAVIVRAYSKSNRNIYGDALLYVGSTFSAASCTGWNKCKDGISISGWDFDFTNPWTIDGWIKGSDGLYIPVIRKIEVTYTDFDGKEVTHPAVTGGVLTYTDLLREAYGDKACVRDVLDKYNLFKYGKGTVDLTPAVPDDFDYKYILFAKMLGAIK